ncbi:MAG TPA: LysR family transcriptional regulator, partial [Casimicrobiaceae bacterium]|nr:LysR family transcriptional regulator [Casimicrobiaceae bacterium]
MTLRIPPLQALRALEAVARSGSLTRAAAELHVTHGAISHQLKGLEDALGVSLVERAGRGVRLTDEGERFASRVKAALAELAEAVREVAERRNPRHFRVSVMPSFAARWLLPRIGRFVAAHRDLDLDVRASTSLVDFRRDDVDAA